MCTDSPINENLSEVSTINSITTSPRPSTSRENPQSAEKNVPSKWRIPNIAGRKQLKRKTRRNLGQQYVSSSGKYIILGRTLGPPCECSKKCRQLLCGTENAIFHSFWDLADYNVQNAYIFSSLKVCAPKRRYHKKTKREISGRKVTVSYNLKVDGKDVKVCKREFLSVHGLQASKKRVHLLVEQIKSARATPKSDGRGRHTNRKNQIPDEIVANIKTHINSIPKYQSHYSREDNPNKLYFDSNLNISTLYKDYYKEWCTENGHTAASEDKYRRVLCSNYNIGFKLPRSDTCKTCDHLHIQINSSNITPAEKRAFETNLELHQRKAAAMQHDLKVSKESDSDVISFDLQQALPTPHLTVGPAFYLRKLWTYNCGD